MADNITDIDAFYKRFEELERRHSLLDIRIQNLAIWQYMRMVYYYELQHLCGLVNYSSTIRKKTIKFRLARAGKMLLDFLFKNPFLDRSSKYLFFGVLRYSSYKNSIVHDAYMYEFMQNIPVDDYTYYQNTNLWDYDGKFDPREHEQIKKYDVLDAMKAVVRRFIKVNFSTEEYALINQIQTSIRELFGVEIDLPSAFEVNIKRSRATYYCCRLLLKIKKPCKIFIVNNYGYRDLVRAANELGIDTVEFQHGIIGHYHPGYNFKGHLNVEGYPRKFYAYGKYWKDLGILPIPAKHIYVYGYPHMRASMGSYIGLEKQPKTVLAISSISDEFDEYLLQNMDDLHGKGYHVYYKLHPQAYDNWRHSPALLKLSGYPNATIVSTEPCMHHLMAICEYQFGLNSTAIFEGLSFKCKTALLNVFGVECLNDLMESGSVAIVNPDQLLSDKLNEINLNQLRKNMFFK